MEKNFLRITTCKCPFCGIKQTAFIYAFDAEGNEVTDPEKSPTGCERGFTCIKPSCGKKVIGIDFYSASEATVGDLLGIR